MAPPVDQNRFQCARVAALVLSNVGKDPAGAAGLKVDVTASASAPETAESRKVCGPVADIAAAGDHRTDATYVSASSVRANRA